MNRPGDPHRHAPHAGASDRRADSHPGPFQIIFLIFSLSLEENQSLDVERSRGPTRTLRHLLTSPKISLMNVSYSELGPREFRTVIGELVAVYAAAMNPPERLIGGREAIMDRHAASPGFRCLTAQADGVVAGFCYGFHGESGQWWHDMVASALASRSGVGYSASAQECTEAMAWLEDSFEIAELHVLPPYQGAGIGRALLLSLTSEREERTAVLSTADAQTPARRLYRGVGFTDLLTGFRFSGSEPPYAVMGALLPLTVARPSAK
jgi:ribosomal protein S18 acetylase RimI-like enzyme